MRLVGLTVDGFRVFGDAVTLDLSDVTACTVVGSNGRGKSTLFDAVLWSLYGDTVEHSAATLVSLGKDVARVSSEWVDREGGVHKFQRSRSGKRSTAVYVDESGGEVSGATKVSDRATFLMGCDRERFKLSCLARQDDLGRFASLPAAKRRSEMVELLVGDLFEDALRTAKEALEEAEAEVVECKQDFETADRVFKESCRLVESVDEVEEMLLNAHGVADDLAKKVERLRVSLNPVDWKMLRKAEDAQKRLDAARERYQGLLMKKPELDSSLGEAKQRAEEGEAARSEVESRYEAAHRCMIEKQEAARDAPTRLRMLHEGMGECWVCSRPLPEKLRADLMRGLKRLILVSRDAKNDCAAAQRDLAAASADAEKWFKKLSEVEGRQREVGSEVKRARDSIDMLVPQVEGLEGLREQADSGGSTPGEVEDAQKEHKVAERKVGGLDERLRRLEEERNGLDDKEREVWECRERIMESEMQEEALRLLHSAFSPNGLPHLLLSTRMADMTAHINRVLSGLRTDGGEAMRIDFRFQKSSGDSELGIDVDTPAGRLDYSLMSGGMRARVDLAIRVGLAHYAGVKCRTMIVDEGTAMLDQQGVDSLLATLEQLIGEGHLESAYLITHDDRLRTVYPFSISVFGDDAGCSQARMEHRGGSVAAGNVEAEG